MVRTAGLGRRFKRKCGTQGCEDVIGGYFFLAGAAFALGLALVGLAGAAGFGGAFGGAFGGVWACGSARRASRAARRSRSLALRRLFLRRVAICLARRQFFLSRRCPIGYSFHRRERTGDYTAPRRWLQPKILN